MAIPRRSWRRVRTCALAVTLLSCGGSPAPDTRTPKASPTPSPTASSATVVAPAEPPALELRTGRLAPRDGQPIELEAEARHVVGGVEFLRAPMPPLPISQHVTITEVGGLWIRVETPAPTLAFVSPDARGTPSLWLRRPASTEPSRGFVYTPALPSRFAGSTAPGHRFALTVRVGPKTQADPRLEETTYERLGSQLEADPTAFSLFAAARLRERQPPTPEQLRLARQMGIGRGLGNADLAPLMDTMTGRLSVQLALQSQRHLHLETAKQKTTVAIEKVAPPQVDKHDWARLRGALGRAAPDEPLARATPAGFYFVRAKALAKLLDVMDVVDDWGQPAASLLDARTEERGTFTRYQIELGLERTGLTRVLGPELVADLALVGSDPYVNEGTDVTLVMRPKSAVALRAALSLVLAKTAQGHGALRESTFRHEGVTVTASRSADGGVRQHRASVNDLELVSNSPGAIRRVISAALGKEPRLGDELDFLYMLARDADAPHDVLCYLGERFIDTVVGPAQKIAQARRQLALSELMVPGFSALLHGIVEGKSPSSKDELVRKKWLLNRELAHADGSPIDWEPGKAARSRWGTVEAEEPLIDLPVVKKVSRAEEEGYRRFATDYQQIWSDAIDPVALRVHHESREGRTALSADLRVLPLLRREYRDFTALVGRAGVVLPGLAKGGRLVAAIGKDASIRRELSGIGRDFGLGKQLHFDWLGDWAMIGAANRNELSNAARRALAGELEPPDDASPVRPHDFDELLVDLPVYAGIGIRSRLGATAMLTLLRKLADDATGSATWKASGSYRGQEIVGVSPHEERLSVYYSLLETAFVISLSKAGLLAAIDQVLDAPPRPYEVTSGARTNAPAPSGDQVILELAGSPGSPFHRMAAWGITRESQRYASSGRSMSEAVLRGAPEVSGDEGAVRALMRAYFGTVLLTPEGRTYRLAPEGVEDPVRGTYHAPAWPALPVPGSLVDRTLSQLRSLRTGLSFDTEPGQTQGQPLESLHARARFELVPRTAPP